MQYFKKSQNKLTRKFTVTLITFAALLLFGTAEASLVVIANPQSHIKTLTKNQLAAIYLAKPVSIKVPVTPYNQPNNTKIFQAFYQDILGWNADQLTRYWTSQIFSGFSQEPASVDSDQAAIQLVEQNTTAIAYVNSRSLRNVGNRVKVIYGHYKIPVQQASMQLNTLYSSSATNGYMTALSSDPASDNSTDTRSPTTDPDMALAQELTSINNSNASQATQNMWRLIASHMQLENEDNNPKVRRWIVWFQEHPRVLRTMVDNATPYLYYVYHQTQRRHMPAEFALLPMIESGYNPRAYSSKGAAGLWQLMPGTASSMGLIIDWWYDSRRDVLMATNVGLNFLVHLHHVTHSWFLAAAAYNVGPGALDAAIRRNKAAGKPTDFWDLRLPNQTEQYVPKLLAISAIIANPSKYGLKLPYVPDHPFFGSVTLTSQMDLHDISQFSGVSIPVIKALNPGLQRWATAPKGHFTLLLPVMSVNTFKINLDKVIGKQHTAWKYHVDAGGRGALVAVPDGATYTKLAGVTGTVKSMQSRQEEILSNALKRAVRSQARGLPAEVTGEPIKASDNLKSLLGKLYGAN